MNLFDINKQSIYPNIFEIAMLELLYRDTICKYHGKPVRVQIGITNKPKSILQT